MLNKAMMQNEMQKGNLHNYQQFFVYYPYPGGGDWSSWVRDIHCAG